MRPEIERGIARWLIRNTVVVLVTAACLFVSSGDPSWVMAWAFLGAVAASKVAIAIVVGRSNPNLLAERGGLPEDAKAWDKALAPVMALYGPALGWIVAGLERRLGSLSSSPPALEMAALAVAVLATLLTIWAMEANKFFMGFCRIATERGHRVASGGPYRYVRHPGYLGALVFQMATPIALGSLWSFIPAALTISATIVRTALEDRTLQDELQGYKDYARQVRYRLLPGIW